MGKVSGHMNTAQGLSCAGSSLWVSEVQRYSVRGSPWDAWLAHTPSLTSSHGQPYRTVVIPQTSPLQVKDFRSHCVWSCDKHNVAAITWPVGNAGEVVTCSSKGAHTERQVSTAAPGWQMWAWSLSFSYNYCDVSREHRSSLFH